MQAAALEMKTSDGLRELPVFLDEDLGRVRIDSISHEGCEFLDVRACGEEVHAIICDDTSKSMQPKPVGLRLWNIPAAGVLSRVSGVWADIPSAMSRKPHALSPIQAGPSVFAMSFRAAQEVGDAAEAEKLFRRVLSGREAAFYDHLSFALQCFPLVRAWIATNMLTTSALLQT